MLRTIVLRNQALNDSLKKAIRTNIARCVSTQLTRRKLSSTVLAPQNKALTPGWSVQMRFYSSLPTHTKVNLPALSPTMENGSIVSWEKKEGDKLSEGDLLCEIETDKATMGFETPEEGYLAKVMITAGTKGVPVGKLLCIIVENQADVAAFKDFQDDSTGAPMKPVIKAAAAAPAPAPAAAAPPAPVPAAAPMAAVAAAPATHIAPAVDPSSRVYASPMARRLAELKNLRLGGQGSGLYGSLKSSDLSGAPAAQAFAPPPAPAPAPGASYVDNPLSGMRETIAKRLTAAKQTIPHYQLAATVNVERTLAMRKSVNEKLTAEKVDIKIHPSTSSFQMNHDYLYDIPVSSMRRTIARRLLESKQTIPHYQLSIIANVEKTLTLKMLLNQKLAANKDKLKVSVNDFIVKAVAAACKRVPSVNSHWMESYIRQFANVDVSVAVATPTGLITPILFNADSRGVIELSRNMKELAAKAKAGKLAPHEYQGGTVTVSNLGMYGITMFNAIINPPQSLILACGGIQELVIPDKNEMQGFRTAKFITFTASADHRVIDGAVGAQWMKAFKENLEDPANMIL